MPQPCSRTSRGSPAAGRSRRRSPPEPSSTWSTTPRCSRDWATRARSRRRRTAASRIGPGQRREAVPLRHSVLWMLRDTTTPEQKVEMLKGLAYLCMECRDVRAGDYGSDLFGGGQPLRDVKPWLRTPRWRSLERPPANFDTALHLDFDDFAGHDAYGADPIHHAASEFNARVADDELTARVDWWYEGPPLTRRGHVRHVAMFVWADGATQLAKRQALDAVCRLEQ